MTLSKNVAASITIRCVIYWARTWCNSKWLCTTLTNHGCEPLSPLFWLKEYRCHLHTCPCHPVLFQANSVDSEVQWPCWHGIYMVMLATLLYFAWYAWVLSNLHHPWKLGSPPHWSYKGNWAAILVALVGNVVKIEDHFSHLLGFLAVMEFNSNKAFIFSGMILSNNTYKYILI